MSARRRGTWPAVVAALVLLLAAGCSTAATDTRAESLGVPDTREEVEDHVWRLQSGDGTPAGAITLEVDGIDLTGTTPCGPYSGEVHVDHDDLEVTDVTSADRGCDEDARRDVDDYLAALAGVTSADVDGDHLTLEGDDVRLELERTDD